jgi:hypothetical protein
VSERELGQRESTIPSVQVDLFRRSVKGFGGGNQIGGERREDVVQMHGELCWWWWLSIL